MTEGQEKKNVQEMLSLKKQQKCIMQKFYKQCNKTWMKRKTKKKFSHWIIFYNILEGKKERKKQMEKLALFAIVSGSLNIL